MKVSELNDKFYEKFKGLPSGAPIVRNHIKNDAFALTTLKILYQPELDIEFEPSQASHHSSPRRRNRYFY